MLNERIVKCFAKRVEVNSSNLQTDEEPKKKFVMPRAPKEEIKIAFVGRNPISRNYNSDKREAVVHAEKAVVETKSSEPVVKAKVLKYSDINIPVETKLTDKTVIEKPIMVEEVSSVKESGREDVESDTGIPNVEFISASISKVSNMIKDWMHINDVYNQLKNDIRDKKMDAKTFYTKVQNCIYHSIKSFCHIGKDSNGLDVPPVVTDDMDCYSTLVFFDRMYNSNKLLSNNNRNSHKMNFNNLMEKYRTVFNDADGIQSEWIKSFKIRMKHKGPLTDHGINEIAKIIEDTWCCKLEENETKELPVVENKEVQEENKIVKDCGCSGHHYEDDEIDNEEYEDNDEEDDYDDEDEDEDDEDEEYEGLKVIINHDDDGDVVRIETSDHYGRIIIPFYCNIENVLKESKIPSLADERNGKWDWLIHLVPDYTFKTGNPEKYLKANDNPEYQDGIKFVIMEEYNGVYVMGVHHIESIVEVDYDSTKENYSSEIINMINYLVNIEVASGYMSHLRRTLNNQDLVKDEEYILNIIGDSDDNDEDDYEDDESGEDEDTDEDLFTKAAIESITTEDNNGSNTTVIQFNEDKVYTPFRRSQD